MTGWLTGFWRRFRQRADRLSLFIALCLSSLSVLCIYAIHIAGYCKDRLYQIQALATGLGLCAVVVMVAFFDYESLAGLWRIYYPLTGLLMVYTAYFGEVREGSNNRSWLKVPGLTGFQPSELWKFAFILAFAWHLAQVREDLNHPRFLIPVLLNAGIGVGAVMLQRDTGVALVMVAIVAAMLFVAGLSRKIILGAAAAAVVSVPIAWNYLLADFHKERILGIFHPQEFEDLAFQQLEGLDSLGSGQIFGIGLFAENHNYVPEIYNDFIFTFIGESLGFVGCMVVVAALSFLCMRILWTGAVSRSYVGKYICTGVFAMLAFQIIVNIGMCLMVLPVIGVTLPFLSYGGTSVLSVYISLGLVMMVNGANKKHMFATS